MQRKRKIYIDPKLALSAVGSKESIEALAVVLGIKITFVNSVVTNASATRLMHILRIGHTRYKRAITYALRQGWLIRERDNIRAAKIKATGSYNVRFVFSTNNDWGARRKDIADVRCPYSLTQLCNHIRQAVLLYHISKQAVVYDTITKATRKSANSSQRSEKRAAEKRAEAWGMRKPKLRRKADRLSYARMSEIAGCSKAKAIALTKSLISGGLISKDENYEKTKLNVEDFYDGDVFNYERFKATFTAYASFGKRGFIVLHDGRIMLRLANSYSITKLVVKYVARTEKQTDVA